MSKTLWRGIGAFFAVLLLCVGILTEAEAMPLPLSPPPPRPELTLRQQQRLSGLTETGLPSFFTAFPADESAEQGGNTP